MVLTTGLISSSKMTSLIIITVLGKNISGSFNGNEAGYILHKISIFQYYQLPPPVCERFEVTTLIVTSPYWVPLTLRPAAEAVTV